MMKDIDYTLLLNHKNSLYMNYSKYVSNLS